jgi:hypothetical protein
MDLSFMDKSPSVLDECLFIIGNSIPSHTYPISLEVSSQALLLGIWVILLLPLGKLLACIVCMLLLPLQESHDNRKTTVSKSDSHQ